MPAHQAECWGLLGLVASAGDVVFQGSDVTGSVRRAKPSPSPGTLKAKTPPCP